MSSPRSTGSRVWRRQQRRRREISSSWFAEVLEDTGIDTEVADKALPPTTWSEPLGVVAPPRRL